MSERTAIAYLTLQGIGQLVALPFHLVVFLFRRSAIRREVREALRISAERHAEPPT